MKKKDEDQGPVWIDALLWTAMVAYVLLCPFTKVEESFNVQATHDLLFVLGDGDVHDFDHHTFPGVVPRTFLGAIALAGVTRPLVELFRLASSSSDLLPPALRQLLLSSAFVGGDTLAWLVCVRIVLGTLTVLALRQFRLAFVAAYRMAKGSAAPSATALSVAFGLLSLTQFHLLFWGSRTLPNTFALILVLHALARWLRGSFGACIVLLVMTGVCFRSEIVLLLGPLVLDLLLRQRVQLFPTIHLGVFSALFFAALSTVVDSYFWQRWLWPEGEGFLFNVVDNKSHLWGVMPWHWYFTYSLPRTLLLALPLLFVGVWADRSAAFALLRPALVYIGLYSFLPHKETRFIFYVIPLLTSVAAIGLAYIHQHRAKNILLRLCWLGSALGLLVAALVCAVFLVAAVHNYPGGQALHRLHASQADRIASGEPTSVHIDVAAAMTGVSRFGELKNPAWTYSKEENLSTKRLLQKRFDFLLTEETQPISSDYRIVEKILAFDGFELVWPPKLRQKVAITIQQRIRPE